MNEISFVLKTPLNNSRLLARPSKTQKISNTLKYHSEARIRKFKTESGSKTAKKTINISHLIEITTETEQV